MIKPFRPNMDSITPGICLEWRKFLLKLIKDSSRNGQMAHIDIIDINETIMAFFQTTWSTFKILKNNKDWHDKYGKWRGFLLFKDYLIRLLINLKASKLTNFLDVYALKLR